jgi:hypothetical protein
VLERKCAACGLLGVLSIDDQCPTCDPVAYQSFRKRKENQVAQFLQANDIKFVQDQIPNGPQCGRERPDFVITHQAHVTCVEVDEDQHKWYACECEQTRMVNITQTFGGLPVLWIRYNPDKFKPKNGIVVQQLSDVKRQEHLLEWIIWSSTQYKPLALSAVVFLFYDGCGYAMSPEDITALPNPLE